jgi:hypothetical protein
VSDPKLQEYMEQIVISFSQGQNEIADALYRIFCESYGAGRVQGVQLLALRRYIIKGGNAVAEAWPWDEQKKKAHAADSASMKAAAAKVMINFAAQNPGLTLGRSEFRDLPRQVRLWCTNGTVLQASAHLLPRALRELAKHDYPEIPTSAGPIWRFKMFLRDYNPVPQVTSAAPGTSDHGQDRAVDFVVIKNGKTIAGTRGATEIIARDWEATGYGKALEKATKGTGLEGPLDDPYEPWHYWLQNEAPDKGLENAKR